MHCNLKKPPNDTPVILGCIWPNIYCTCAETALSELPVNTDTALELRDRRFLYDINILPISGHLPAFLAIFSPRICRNPISELLVKILTPFLDSATPISWQRAIILQWDDIFTLLFHSTEMENLSYFFFWSIWHNDLEHVSQVELSTGLIYPPSLNLVNLNGSRLITLVLLIRYITLWPWPLILWPSTRNIVPNFRDIEEYTAELQQFKD